jgi:TetR/AcrR family transcriptional regulator, tetracycline repressor protein
LLSLVGGQGCVTGRTRNSGNAQPPAGSAYCQPGRCFLTVWLTLYTVCLTATLVNMIVRKGSERVPRGTLNRERTVTAALELLDEEGLDALSMPRLAHRLGVGTMSLYSHLEGKDDLLDAVVNRVFETVMPPSGPRGDVGRVVDNFREFRRVALEHPAVGRLLVDRLTRTSTVLRNLEVSLGILRDAGYEGGDAVRLYYTLFHYTLGAVLWAAPRGTDEYAAAWAAVLRGLSQESYPLVLDYAGDLASVATEEQFEWGLSAIARGARHPLPETRSVDA